MAENNQNNKKVKYKATEKNFLKIEFPQNLKFNKVGSNVYAIPISMNFTSVNTFIVNFGSFHELNIFFADIFPFSLLPKKEDENQVVRPNFRIIYPASGANTLLESGKIIFDKEIHGLNNTLQKIAENQKEKEKIIEFSTLASYQMPYIYANACLFLFDSSNQRFRLLFGYTFEKGTLEIPVLKEDYEKFVICSLGLELTIKSLKTFLDVLEKTIKLYNNQFLTEGE